MADGVISFPFRITPQGAVATAPYASDQEVDEAIALLTLTQTGERVMAPDYGIEDPTWGSITVGDVQTGLDEHGPEGIVIEGVDEEPLTETHAAYTIRWSRDPVEQEDLT